MRNLRGRLSFANVMSVIAVFIALGGTSYAAFKLPKNSVGARQLKNRSITPAKLSARTKRALRGATGPIGPAGSQGPKGDPGAPATTLWAVIGFEGLDSGSGVASVGHPGEGKYTVVFNQNVSGCAYSVTPGTTAAGDGVTGWPEPGQATVGPLKDNPNGIVISRATDEGAYVDLPVFVAVFC